MMYLILIPISAIAITKKIDEIKLALKNDDRSKLKAEVFLLGLMLIIILFVTWMIKK